MANKKKTIAEVEQELYEVHQRQTLNKVKNTSPTKLEKIPDPKLHQVISFVKSGIRIASCSVGLVGAFEVAFFGLLVAEVVGIIEELV